MSVWIYIDFVSSFRVFQAGYAIGKRAMNDYDLAKCIEDSLSNNSILFQDSLQSVDAERWLTRLMISICIVLRSPEYALVAGKWEDLLFVVLLVSR